MIENAERVAILRVAPEILGELLKLPPGAYIDAVHAPHDQPGSLELRVRGAGWVTPLGNLIPKITGILRRYNAEDGTVLVIDWGLPE